MAETKEVLIPVSNLVPGMTAARDIYSRNDQLLIAGGTKIDENGIARITFFGILSVTVLVEEDDHTLEEMDAQIMGDDNESEMVQKFMEEYDSSIISVSHAMNQLLESGTEINERELIHEVEKVVAVTNNKYQVFDMLHYLRNYDDETYMHSVNVSMICNVFGDWLGMSEYEKKHLTLCGLLHDFGKLLISKDILRKPGRLTENEFQIIKEHPVRGYEFLKDKKIHESVKRAVLLHHERTDGKGYPFGNHISEIDPYAAITGIADVYEAMTANRVYRKGICPFEVIRIFEEEGRHQFNPVFLVPILNKITEAYLQHEVELSDGSKGKIVLINQDELWRPTVLCAGKIINLSKVRDVEIVKVL